MENVRFKRCSLAAPLLPLLNSSSSAHSIISKHVEHCLCARPAAAAAAAGPTGGNGTSTIITCNMRYVNRPHSLPYTQYGLYARKGLFN